MKTTASTTTASTKNRIRAQALMAVVCAAGAWLAGSTQAQPLPDARMIAYLNSEPYKQMITMLGIVYDEHILQRKQPCQSGYKWEPISLALQQPLLFQVGAEHPYAGAWTYRFKFERCGESTVYNVLLQGQANKPPRPIPLVPGLTRANPQLMSDLMMPLVLSGVAAGMPSDCKNIQVIDTEVTAEPFALQTNGQVFPGAWQELWKARACGKAFTAEFCLVPQPQGGTNWSQGQCRK